MKKAPSLHTLTWVLKGLLLPYGSVLLGRHPALFTKKGLSLGLLYSTLSYSLPLPKVFSGIAPTSLYYFAP